MSIEHFIIKSDASSETRSYERLFELVDSYMIDNNIDDDQIISINTSMTNSYKTLSPITGIKSVTYVSTAVIVFKTKIYYEPSIEPEEEEEKKVPWYKKLFGKSKKK